MSAASVKLRTLFHRPRLSPPDARDTAPRVFRRARGSAGTELGSACRTRQTVRIAESISRRRRGAKFPSASIRAITLARFSQEPGPCVVVRGSLECSWSIVNSCDQGWTLRDISENSKYKTVIYYNDKK